LKLRKLLNEASAAEEAKKKGLEADAFGRWKNKQGKVVARTDPDTGKLVPVNGDEDGQPRDQSSDQAKPTGTSAEKAGTAPKSAPGQEDIEKQNGMGQDKGGEMGDGGEGEPEANPMATVKVNPHIKSFKLGFGKPVDPAKLDKYIPDAIDPLNAKEEFVIGEEVIISKYQDTHDFLFPYNGSKQFELDAVHDKASEQQVAEWRSKLPNDDYRLLAEAQESWQSTSPNTNRDYYSNIFRAVGMRSPAISRLGRPIERGMRFEDAGVFKKLMSEIRIGEPVSLPASGFTANPAVARRLADSSRYGVLVRLAPNKNNEIYGIHCNTDYDPKRLPHDVYESAQSTADNFSDEQEIIRYPGPQAKCVNVTKVLTKTVSSSGHDVTTCLMIIDLEEQGYPDKNLKEGKNMRLHPLQRRFKAMTENDPGDGDAAQQAHDLGLTHVGGGYWIDSSGDVVAQTMDGKLVKYTGNDMGKHKVYVQGKPYNKGTMDKPAEKELPTASAKLPSPEGKANETLPFKTGLDLTGKTLNGIPFEPWKEAMTMTPDQWNALENPNIKEPAWPASSKKKAAGVIVVEPDGRLWLVEPANHFGGYEHTFPKGKIDDGMNSQGTAVKEAYEESGLKVEITGYAADSERSTSITRYYFAKRTGGDPTMHGWESQAVKLVPPNELDKHLNMDVDKKLAQQLLAQMHNHGPHAAPSEKPPEKVNTGKANVMAKKVGNQQGTNKGGFYEGADGVLRYVKEYKNPLRSDVEALANGMYSKLGIAAPKSQVIEDNGQKLFASDVVQGEELQSFMQKVSPVTQKVVCQGICDGFVADVLLANWDAVGLEWDNIVVDVKGPTPYRIDQGASFMFRAMESSGEKPDALLGQITEWEAFNDPTKNNAYHKVMKTAGYNSPEEIPSIQKQIKAVRACEQQHGGWDKMVDELAGTMPPNAKQKVVQMLNARSKLLYNKALEMKFKSRDI
jgi:ADP-ribose pyrophosphatase YjhB (NUDIX family)